MASPRLVKIHEASKVTPSSADSTISEFTLPLTFFDTFWFGYSPVERLFFYQLKDLTSHFFNSVIIPKLKRSLSITLFHYLPLAGNLMWPPGAPKPALYYFPGDGVSVTVAESNADFNFLSGNGFRGAVEFRPLLPQLLTSDDKAAAIAIQITLFPNQGFSIGIATHHVILDGKSSTTFIKSWAYLCKQDEEDLSLSPDLTPSLDRSVIRDPDGKDKANVNFWLHSSGSDTIPKARSFKLMLSLEAISNLVHATFELSREDIKMLRDKISNEVNDSKQLHLSTFVLSCAYTFLCMVKIKREGNRNIAIGFAADYRSRLDPPVPPNYFGNCITGHGVAAQAKDFMEESGFSFVAEKLSDLVRRVERAVEGLTPMECYELVSNAEKVLSVAGSNRFNVYGTDFGWGSPMKVEIVSIAMSGAISIAESRDGGGGVEIGVVLEKQEMEAFAALFTDGLKD